MTEMSIYDIHIATTEAERLAAFRLRYELYVAGQGLFDDVADHERRLLCDEADAHALIFVAEREGELVGTARLQWCGDGPLDHELRAQFDIERFTDIVDLSEIALVSRMLIAPAHRGARLLVELSMAVVREVASRGTPLLLADCEPHLVNTWAQFGMRPYSLTEHPTNGTLVCLALIMGDVDHARAVDSPLVQVMRGSSARASTAQRIRARVTESTQVMREAADRRRFWAEVEPSFPLDRLSGALGGLNVDERDVLLGNCLALSCEPRSMLIRKGHTSRTLYMLLTGSLEIWDEGRLIATPSEPGTIVGEVAWFSDGPRMSDVVTGERGARVLALSERNLKKLLAARDSGAVKFLLSLMRGLGRKLRERSGCLPLSPPASSLAPLPRARAW